MTMLGMAAILAGLSFVLGMAAGLWLAVAIVSWHAPEPDADAS